MPDMTLGAGDVPILLDGKEMVLRPSLKAAMAVSKLGQGSGFRAVIAKLEMYDFDTLVAIIGLVIGQSKNLPEAIYTASGRDEQGNEAHGVFYVTPIVMRFVHILMRGGQPLPSSVADADSGEDEERDHPPKTGMN